MRRWLSNWRNRRDLDVAAELRAAKPEASARFVKSIAARVNPRPVQPVRTRTRLGLAAAVTATLVAVVGATGGFSSAASSIAGATHSVTHFSITNTPAAAPPHTPPTVHNPSGPTSAGDQYAAAPTITGFSPSYGAPGSTVTVQGTNFAGASSITEVQLNGEDAGYVVTSSSSLTFTVPADASSGTITVTNAADSATSTDSFTVVQTPVIDSADPTEGGAGTVVALTGSHFTGVTGAKVGTTAATFSFVSDTEVDVTVPAAAKAGASSISVSNKVGSASIGFTVDSGAPVVSSFKPTSGKLGDTITLTGKFFTGATEVDFNGTPGTNLSVGSDTSLTVKVPSGADSGPLTVVNGVGSGVSKTSFTVIVTPVITGFSPTSGKVGTKVTISGSSFLGATEVDFNGTNAGKITVKTGTKGGPDTITANVPVGATSGPITVTNGVGTSDPSDDFHVVTAVPTLTSATPNHAAAGAGTAIVGSNLTDVTGVTVNGKAATFDVTDDTDMTVNVPIGAPAGSKGGIVATNAFGKSAALTFTVDATAPTITKVTNGSGKPMTAGEAGNTVILTGTNLADVTDVSFGGGDVLAADFTAQSATGITLAIPSDASTGVIQANKADGSYGQAKGTFTIYKAPVVLGFSPAYGKAPGQKVTIVGTNLIGATDVQFGDGGHAKPTYNSKDGSLSVVVPKDAHSGAIKVTVNGDLTGDSGNNGFTVVTKPTPGAGNPTTAARGSQITLTGTGFLGVTSVKIGSTACVYSVTDDGHIKITIPASAKTGSQTITITNAAGTGTYKLTIT